MRSKRKKKFRNLSLKKEFCDNLEKFIKKNPQYGYRSLAQFVEDASRLRLEALGAFKTKAVVETPL